MIDCVYYTHELRCYRNGVVEKFWKKGWKVVENVDNFCGYNRFRINDKKVLRHRLIAFCFLGLNNIVGKSGGHNCIDHINGDKIYNHIDNLRITTPQGNNQNRKGVKGYNWSKRDKKWNAKITLNNKKIYLGLYNTEEDARQAYLTAKLKYHIH